MVQFFSVEKMSATHICLGTANLQDPFLGNTKPYLIVRMLKRWQKRKFS